MQHFVRKQIIELSMPGSRELFEVQQTVSNYYLHKILPVLEQIFNELSDEDETIFIDHLQIDLGSISEKDITLDKWSAQIASEITAQLHKKIKIKKGKPNNQELRSLSVCRQWLFYMEKGWLPWNALHTNEAWYMQVLEGLAIDYSMVSQLGYLIGKNYNVARRIVWQHQETFLIKLVEILTTEKQNRLAEIIVALQEFLHQIKRFDIAVHNPVALQKNIWQRMMQYAAVEGSKLTQDALLEKTIRYYLPDISMIRAMAVKNALIPASISPVLKKLSEHPGPLLNNGDAELKEQRINETESSKNVELHTENHQDQRGDQRDNERYDRQIDEEGVFVLNAGTVLLHAFLPALLDRLQWVSNRKFANREAQQKALYLLHYLATGKTNAEEHELAIPKVLCAWNLKQPVEKEIDLAAEELDEATHMMHSAIEQWTVLKTTSIDGLREGFLQRNGKLFTKNDKLYLQVEQHSIDILLDQLPWNLSMIKLPWMKEILRVEWR